MSEIAITQSANPAGQNVPHPPAEKSRHPLGRTKAETATLMFLTRLAMFFERQGNNRFTGEVVAQVILGAWQSYELSKETPEIERFLAAYLPDLAADAHTGDLIDSLVSTVEKAEAAHGTE